MLHASSFEPVWGFWDPKLIENYFDAINLETIYVFSLSIFSVFHIPPFVPCFQFLTCSADLIPPYHAIAG